jgi:hypothetical protein
MEERHMTPLELRCIKALARGMIAAGNGPVMEQAASALTALLSELNAAGWQVVPKEATREMVMAAIDRPADPDAIMYGPIYRAMLAAAPKPFEGGK